MSKKKEIIITIGEEVFRLREGESRQMTMPILLMMQDGVLSIGYPAVYSQAKAGYPIVYNKKKDVPDPDGAPAPTAADLKVGREYEQREVE